MRILNQIYFVGRCHRYFLRNTPERRTCLIHCRQIEMKVRIALCPLFLLSALGSAVETANYGADVSFPIHHAVLHDGPLGNRKAIYQEFMNGCREFYGVKGNRCDISEDDRLEMSLRQCQSMVVSRCSMSRNLFTRNTI